MHFADCNPVWFVVYYAQKMKGEHTMNTTLFYSLITRYCALAFTHSYIFGFEYKGNVYMTFATSEILPYILKLDKASRGAGYALRFKPDTAQKLLLLPMSQILCSAEYFNSEVANSKYNAGEIFEKMVTEWFGQKWEKDNVPFTEAGDIEANGTAYQIKFQKATFTNEKSLARLESL